MPADSLNTVSELYDTYLSGEPSRPDLLIKYAGVALALMAVGLIASRLFWKMNKRKGKRKSDIFNRRFD